LPRKGDKCITVKEKLHEEIRKKSKEANLTMKEYMEYLMTKEKATKTGK
jgi:hypothetical protein